MQVKKGDQIKVHYIGTLNDGTEFDNSYKRNEPIAFPAQMGNMIKGFDDAVIGMSVGEKKSINIPAVDAYGPQIEEAIMTVPKTNFPPDFAFEEGALVQGQTESGQPIQALMVEIRDEEVVLDMNHPLAGEDLNFDIELVEIGG